MDKGNYCNSDFDAECMYLNENNQYFVNVKNDTK